MLHVDPIAHAYWWHDGRAWVPLFSVTEVLSGGKGWMPHRIALRGRAVHAATAAFHLGGNTIVPEAWQGYVDAYLHAVSERHVDWIYIEHALANPRLRVAGTVDRFGFIDGEYTVVDLKTTNSTVRASGYGHQLAGYALLIAPDAPDVLRREAWLLHDDGSYDVRDYDSPADIDYFRAKAATARGEVIGQFLLGGS